MNNLLLLENNLLNTNSVIQEMLLINNFWFCQFDKKDMLKVELIRSLKIQ